MRALLPLFLVACSSSITPTDGGTNDSGSFDSSIDANDLPTGVCAMEHRGTNADGELVTICDSTFDTLPFVRLPPDDATTIYAGVSSRLELRDRNGKSILLVGANGDPLGKGLVQMGDNAPQVGPPGLRMLSNRYLFTLWRLKGAMVKTVDSNGMTVDGFRLDDARAMVLLDGKAIDSQLLGAWEGTVSKRVSQTQWDENTRVPVRVKLSNLDPTDAISVWGYAMQKLPDGKRFVAGGMIENASAKVKASDGACLDALDSAPGGNPFDGTAPSLMRVAGMHAPGDDVIVMGGDMAGNFEFVSPWGLTRTSVPADWTNLQFYPHGTPNGYRLDLHKVTGGGGGC